MKAQAALKAKREIDIAKKDANKKPIELIGRPKKVVAKSSTFKDAGRETKQPAYIFIQATRQRAGSAPANHQEDISGTNKPSMFRSFEYWLCKVHNQ